MKKPRDLSEVKRISKHVYIAAAALCLFIFVIYQLIYNKIVQSERLLEVLAERPYQVTESTSPPPETVTVFVTVPPDARLEFAAGTTEVRGSGVVVTLSDNDGDVIHDGDLLALTNELRDAGAEALAINGIRLTALSEVRCAGAVVSISGKRTSAPFEIAAIGSPDELYRALDLTGGAVDLLRKYGFTVLAERRGALTLPAAQLPDFEYITNDRQS